MNSTTDGKDFSWPEIVKYLARRLRDSGEDDAKACALRFEQNIGLDRNKLLTAAREELNRETKT